MPHHRRLQGLHGNGDLPAARADPRGGVLGQQPMICRAARSCAASYAVATSG